MPRYDYVERSGLIIPDTADILAEVRGEFRDAFGEALSVEDETPQGALMVAEAQSRAEAITAAANLANQINPDYAGGVFLDHVAALLGIQRRTATRTVVTGVTLSGQPATIIPTGSRARATSGGEFRLVAAVTLGGGGTGTGTFEAVETGPVAAAAGTLTVVVDAVLGWDSVTNPTAGALGVDEESDEALRLRRRNVLALQGLSTTEAISAEVLGVEGVRSLLIRENTTNANLVLGPVTLVPHSIYACVDGGAAQEIGEALFRAKTAGAAFNGAEAVNVTDPITGVINEVLFDLPQAQDFLVRVSVRRGTFSGDIPGTVTDAVVRYANGEIDGETGFIVGGSVSPFEIAGAIAREAPGLFVALVEVRNTSAPGGGTWETTEISLAINEVARAIPGSVTVIVL